MGMEFQRDFFGEMVLGLGGYMGIGLGYSRFGL